MRSWCVAWARKRTSSQPSSQPSRGTGRRNSQRPPPSSSEPGINSPSASQSYYTPLLTQLSERMNTDARLGQRVEVVEPQTKGAARYVGETMPLARGWERQADITDNPIFYAKGALDATSYRSELDDALTLPLRHVDAGVRRLALRFAYGVWYRQPVAFPLVASGQDAEASRRWRDPSELVPGQQLRNEQDKLPGHVESDTIGDQRGVSRQADFFGETSSTGSSAPSRRCPPLSACPPVCPL